MLLIFFFKKNIVLLSAASVAYRSAVFKGLRPGEGAENRLKLARFPKMEKFIGKLVLTTLVNLYEN